MKKPKRTAADLAAELQNEGPQGMTKHELSVARRHLRREPLQIAFEVRRIRALEQAALAEEAPAKAKAASEAMKRLTKAMNRADPA